MRRLLRFLLVGRRKGVRARVRRAFGLFTWLDERKSGSDRTGEPLDRIVPVPVPTPSGFEAVIKRDQLVPGEVTEAIVGGMAVAIANVDGEYFAVSNVCPHAGGPLGDGTLEGRTLTCPYHGWSFDVSDGSCFVTEDVQVEVFPVKIVQDMVCVKVSGETG